MPSSNSSVTADDGSPTSSRTEFCDRIDEVLVIVAVVVAYVAIKGV